MSISWHQICILRVWLQIQSALTPVRCATPPSMDTSCAASVYPSRRRPCASRRSRSDAPVIRRKTPPRRQRVLSPSPAQWSPGSSLGLWCKSLLFILPKKNAPVSGGLEINCGSQLLRPFETMRVPRCLHGDPPQDRASVCKGKQIRLYSSLTGNSPSSCCHVGRARPGQPLFVTSVSVITNTLFYLELWKQWHMINAISMT